MTDTILAMEKASSKAEEIGKKTIDVVKEVNRFNNAMTIGKSGGDLNKVINTLTGSSLSKISAGLGALGATISFISLFTSSKSSDQLIMDMLGDIDQKIDSLQDIMLNRFDHLEAVVENAIAKGSISHALSVLDTAISYVNELLNSDNDSQRKAALKDLKTVEPKEIRTAVTAISHVVNNSIINNNIYDSELKTSYGDVVDIQKIGITLNYYLTTANIIDNLLHCLDVIPEDQLLTLNIPDEENPLDYVPTQYLDGIQGALDNNAKYYEDVISDHKRKWLSTLKHCEWDCDYYIDKYFITELVPKLNADEHEKSVNIIIDSLSSKWGWLDFFSVVYKDVTGFSKHVMRGGECKTYFRQPVKNGKVNVVIAWDSHTDAGMGSRRNTNVSYTYRTTVGRGTTHPHGVDQTYNGKAEDFNYWGDLRDVLNSLTDNPPTRNRFIWAAKKKQGSSRSQSSSKRILWVNGKHLDIAIFE